MAGEGGNIIRNVFGKSYKEAESITKDASKGALDFKSPKEATFHGKEGGKKFNEYKAKKDTLPVRVLTVKCYEDFECKKEVTIIEKEKKYFYKVIQYNRKPTKAELKNLKWGIQYDDGKIADAPQVTGEEKISHFVSTTQQISKVRAYAYFKAPNKNASAEIEIETICDAIMVVGSELHEPTYGNKMRFFAQAVRTLLLNKDKWKKVSLIYFNYKNKYNAAEINEVKKSLSSYSVKDIEFISITTVSEMINKINSYKKIKMLHFYSHGMPSKITFGLGHVAENIDGAQTFTFSDISKLKKNVFDKIAQIHSYACRTGNAQKNPMQDDFTPYYTIHYFAGKADFTEKHLTKESAQKRYIELKRGFTNVYIYEPSTSPSEIHSEQSLAQKLASHTGISVFAYKTRSDYQPTWHGNLKKIEIPDESVEKGWFGAKFWQDGDNALWNSTGALNGVKGGSTPKGLDNKLTEFKP
jgi:hypothetical protein